MKGFHILKDQCLVGWTATKEAAIDMIRQQQASETHYLLRANFSIIEGEEEFISYENKPSKSRHRQKPSPKTINTNRKDLTS